MQPAKPDSRQQILFMSLALAATLPGVYLRITGIHPEPILAAILYGMAIVGAAFILSWAAEVIQMDIAAGLALALLALIAILPEYAVDFVFTAKAGQEFAETGAATQYGPLALANMTGGNQLLIGLGWPMVILIGTWRVKKTRVAPSEAEGTTPTEINLSRSQSVDIAYLTIASVYGLTLFLKDELSLFDAAVLVTIYVLYLRRLSGAPTHEPHLVGPSAYIGSLPKRTRRIINYAMFVVAAGVILLCAEAFAESIIELGEAIG
ncbi:MAG TPA: sodium:proton exchanger, partial [Acidimicrobiia bacterium]|nr:sodium:proton exchanger [Acidimicrobiia bacterium]